jgi:hypothetical protein
MGECLSPAYMVARSVSQMLPSTPFTSRKRNDIVAVCITRCHNLRAELDLHDRRRRRYQWVVVIIGLGLLKRVVFDKYQRAMPGKISKAIQRKTLAKTISK